VLTGELTVSATKTITKLKRQLKRAGISQERVALEANVTRTMVNHVVNGRARSRRVLFAIERLLERCAEAAHA
jgi:transcriptional regulator with XRE-family HTH domain